MTPTPVVPYDAPLALSTSDADAIIGRLGDAIGHAVDR
jgi:hypothetical protein